ncbi:RNA-binding RNA processing protein [Saccharomycopsis crataegensis]|uniref:RNA-binding RNA processing protein n=1 Tax=Saccharomycopsis crataegensis TaxID=43959 RepID=A0AAV5QQ69_9ASCO|nr:RNA-binding RNA processing protein [Saccharomycopsis crataegensis]
MLFDLNIPWPSTTYAAPSASEIAALKSILAMLQHLQYTHIALNFQLDPSLKLTKKDFAKKSPNPIDLSLFEHQFNLKIYTRITLTLHDPADFPGLKLFSDHFDLIAIKPLNDRALSVAITNFDFDIISFNYKENLKYWLRNKAVHSGAAKGKYFEIVYAPVLQPDTRKNFLSVCKNLVRASRSQGILISSGAERSVQVKTKLDLQIMCKIINIAPHRVAQIINENPSKVMISGRLRNQSYKQSVAMGSDILETKKHKIDDDEIAVLRKLQKK